MTCGHKLPNIDLVVELESCWNKDFFHLRKVKSHRSFDSEKKCEDLWTIAGNYCLLLQWRWDPCPMKINNSLKPLLPMSRAKSVAFMTFCLF